MRAGVRASRSRHRAPRCFAGRVGSDGAPQSTCCRQRLLEFAQTVLLLPQGRQDHHLCHDLDRDPPLHLQFLGLDFLLNFLPGLGLLLDFLRGRRHLLLWPCHQQVRALETSSAAARATSWFACWVWLGCASVALLMFTWFACMLVVLSMHLKHALHVGSAFDTLFFDTQAILSRDEGRVEDLVRRFFSGTCHSCCDSFCSEAPCSDIRLMQEPDVRMEVELGPPGQASERWRPSPQVLIERPGLRFCIGFP